jgi:hypothetical protein
LTRQLSPWPHRLLYALAAILIGTGVVLAYIVTHDLKALGPFGAVGGAALVLAISDHLTYQRLRKDR